ncbi:MULTISPECIES: nucleotide exchange factor GrpE [Pseudomonas]|jgi:molecular chaperone GrpE|uniref:Protein GrpE n=2 Tax=Pseudomonas putida TaxID=303 RepID=A0A1X0ZF69_PSEPU|nr:MULTISPECIES: nucleotide exchange factor GrpE [Pseudomonas]MDN5674396.1 nucleotide exchange factor GrpE [Pseudomonas sp.]EKT4463394.1 nucleotide exchange factor GrpE [Pseudomonas putida]EKT4557615.1 nucleotide exchange factor GrpE [Pseudomonas putida]ELF6208161.1 nucleotide exchange factor GrpE [Pseudomonas putida]ELU0816337.1 nucleotide exchange factor GrpE [Pseudomonas putida]
MADEQLNEKDLNVEETGAGTAADTRVLELEEQLAAAKDQALRAVADVQNVRRRAEQDVEKAHKFALEKFSNDLLPVIDSLELALAHSSDEDEQVKAIREGVKLTLKMFQDTLKRYNLEVVDPHGEPFNPEHHQAMAMQESAEVEPNSVLNVFQKGYLLNGRLLRPAMVVVSKAPSAAQPSINEKA